ncbi:hypothetical protein ACWDR1_31505 [Streptosporangium sandarakinum]
MVSGPSTQLTPVASRCWNAAALSAAWPVPAVAAASTRTNASALLSGRPSMTGQARPSVAL